MSNLTRRDPLYLDPFESLFKGFMVKPFQMETTTPQIKMDVKENEKAYTVYAEIPGVEKDNIHVDIDQNRVSISAEVKKESEEKKGDVVLRSERYYGTVARSFTLENEIDEAAATARYTDGVLELTLPKRVTVAARRLSIS
jgi:HSP20 family protein